MIFFIISCFTQVQTSCWTTWCYLYISGVAPLIIFGPTIAKQTGYAAVTVGVIYTVLPLVGLLVKTISGAVADKFNRRKSIFLLAIFCCLFSAVCMTFIRTPISRKKVTLLCHTDTFLSTCDEKIVKMRRTSILNNNNTGDINCEVLELHLLIIALKFDRKYVLLNHSEDSI